MGQRQSDRYNTKLNKIHLSWANWLRTTPDNAIWQVWQNRQLGLPFLKFVNIRLTSGPPKSNWLTFCQFLPYHYTCTFIRSSIEHWWRIGSMKNNSDASPPLASRTDKMHCAPSISNPTEKIRLQWVTFSTHHTMGTTSRDAFSISHDSNTITWE